MLKLLLARLQQRHRTMKYPAAPAPLPAARFRGRPVLDAAKCPDHCTDCAAACPTGALCAQGGLAVDLGKCLFCAECAAACPHGAIRYTNEYRLATRRREDLVMRSAPADGATLKYSWGCLPAKHPQANTLEGVAGVSPARGMGVPPMRRGGILPPHSSASAGEPSPFPYKLAEALEAKTRRLFGRSLKLRQVSAGGCGACEADTNVLNTVGWDLSRFGIGFVASPRHADGLLVTGPVTANMQLALRKTYDAVPAPKLVIAVGACAIAGGPYIGHDEVSKGLDTLLPVDLFIPGCPPHPLTILDGLLRLLGRLEE